MFAAPTDKFPKSFTRNQDKFMWQSLYVISSVMQEFMCRNPFSIIGTANSIYSRMETSVVVHITWWSSLWHVYEDSPRRSWQIRNLRGGRIIESFQCYLISIRTLLRLRLFFSSLYSVHTDLLREPFMTLALDGDEWSASSPSRLNPGEDVLEFIV